MDKSNYDEIRRVRHEMSQACGHDTQKLIEMINQSKSQYAHRIINPGKSSEQCDLPPLPSTSVPSDASTANT